MGRYDAGPRRTSIGVMFLAAEALPYAKVGGLGDVAGSLPGAIRALPTGPAGQVDVRLVLPLHPVIKRTGMRLKASFVMPYRGRRAKVDVYAAQHGGVPAYLIDGGPVRAAQGVYATDGSLEADKFVFFSLASLHLPDVLGWSPDILHANDWHSALATYAGLGTRAPAGARRLRTIATIHNLAYLGPDVRRWFKPSEYGAPRTDLPAWARFRPFPLGLWAADAIVAVSPRYAAEITTRTFGVGLDAFFRRRRARLHGILNGIDTVSFDPANDAALHRTYSVGTLERRAANKDFLQSQLGLQGDPHTLLFGLVSRLSSQKGVDVLVEVLRQLAGDERWQAVVLGVGDPRLEARLRALERDMPGRLRAAIRYDDGLARQIFAGADAFLMPSRHEPCGLTQMIAMRYGCIPVVRAVGGLRDTVLPGVNGFTFERTSAAAFKGAVREALAAFRNPRRWRQMQKRGMRGDFTWTRSARKYLDLYRSLLRTEPVVEG